MVRPHQYVGAFLVAALLGFTGIAAGAVEIAKVLFFIFILLFAALLVVGRIGRM